MARFNTETDRTRDGTNFTLYIHITPNNKKYFGITSQEVENRWQHDGVGYNHQKLFWRAIQKYGWDNIQHIVLAENLSKEWACKLEQDLIWKYKTHDSKCGYNNTLGGEGITGYKLTEEQIETRRRNSTGRRHSLESRKLMSEKQRGRIVTAEMRKNMSLAHIGKPAHNKGKSFSVEARQHMSQAKLGKPGNHTQHHTEETKRKISEHSKGRAVSQETREKLRQKALEQWKRQKERIIV